MAKKRVATRTPDHLQPVHLGILARAFGYVPYAEDTDYGNKALRRHFGAPDDVLLNGDGLQAHITSEGLDLQDWTRGDQNDGTHYCHVLTPCTVAEAHAQLVHQGFHGVGESPGDLEEFMEGYREAVNDWNKRAFFALMEGGKSHG
jgi:hypothetical protein